ncbi:MAG: hypothetical protein Q7U02_14830 [Desulfosalsimonadaceae bacterium]|nr:hypothetical protein [Desulfosalsimonadaceae bacterium]
MPYLFRPYLSWLETHSPAITAPARGISPQSTVAATISVNFPTFPAPKHPHSSRHSLWVARPVPPPWFCLAWRFFCFFYTV